MSQESDLDSFDAWTGLRPVSHRETVVDAVTHSTSREGEMNGAAQALATAALVDLAQGSSVAGIIATQQSHDDTPALVLLRHLADPFMRPILDDLLLANSGAGMQLKRLYKIAMKGGGSPGGNAANAFKRLLRPSAE